MTITTTITMIIVIIIIILIMVIIVVAIIVIKLDPGVDSAKGLGCGLYGSTWEKKNIWNFNFSYEKIKEQFMWI